MFSVQFSLLDHNKYKIQWTSCPCPCGDCCNNNSIVLGYFYLMLSVPVFTGDWLDPVTERGHSAMSHSCNTMFPVFTFNLNMMISLCMSCCKYTVRFVICFYFLPDLPQ